MSTIVVAEYERKIKSLWLDHSQLTQEQIVERTATLDILWWTMTEEEQSQVDAKWCLFPQAITIIQTLVSAVAK